MSACATRKVSSIFRTTSPDKKTHANLFGDTHAYSNNERPTTFSLLSIKSEHRQALLAEANADVLLGLLLFLIRMARQAYLSTFHVETII